MTAPFTNADIQFDAVVVRVCEAYAVERGDLLGKKRHGRTSWARQVAYLALSEGAHWTQTEIATAFDRNWSTINYGIDRVKHRSRAVRDERELVEWVLAVFDPAHAAVLDERAEIESALRLLDSAMARAAAMRGVLAERLGTLGFITRGAA